MQTVVHLEKKTNINNVLPGRSCITVNTKKQLEGLSSHDSGGISHWVSKDLSYL